MEGLFGEKEQLRAVLTKGKQLAGEYEE
ncbi:Protein of unknown function [Bacillus cereus]|uniref:Uncharacterized protein n=1 Tax=Bacillus wiedmannii TaxID=1890302 RepID=A0AB37YMG7_9BACI|nr:Protein of unknown function [Bacillus wiedmannii]SCN05518.1 Protein of unknown function [Bacillus wiedmannii]SCV18644.1 Protein of unknown function [Bacillus cereus]